MDDRECYEFALKRSRDVIKNPKIPDYIPMPHDFALVYAADRLEALEGALVDAGIPVPELCSGCYATFVVPPDLCGECQQLEQVSGESPSTGERK